MRRAPGWAAAVALVTAGYAVTVQAQEMVEVPRFEIGLYGGGAYSSDWFESRTASSTGGVVTESGEGEGYGFGLTPAFGGTLAWYLRPSFGLRLHYGFVPSGVPSADDDADSDDGYPLNNHFYDLNLLFRPWAARGSGLLAQSYLFLGGGGLTSNLASGEGDTGCDPGLLTLGACLPVEGDPATVGQGVIGIGFDLFPLGPFGFFAELAAHGYDSPVHVGGGFVPPIEVDPGETFAVADDRYAVTTRFVAGLKVGLGSFAPPMMAVAPPPPPSPAPPAPPPPPAPPAERALAICVVQGNALATIQAMYNPATGDTMVAGRAFAVAHPATAPGYAAGAGWFVSGDELTMEDREYVKFGVERIVQPPQLRYAGMYQGTALFAETAAEGPPEILYVPVRPGCNFQPYQLREALRPRG